MQKLKKMDSRGEASEKRKANHYIFLQKIGEIFMGTIVPWILQQPCVAQFHPPWELFCETSVWEALVSRLG